MESHDMKYRYTGTRLVLLVLTGISLSATKTVAQTTVQLPTVQRFGVSTTVVVPAGRSVSLGAIGRSSRGRNGFGTPFGGPLPGLGNRLLVALLLQAVFR
jgi:type II secretory pathway component GspD/PulD (secretin)